MPEPRGYRNEFRPAGERRGGGSGGFRPRRPYVPAGAGIDYRSLVEFIAKSVAEKPEEVRVNSYDRGRGAVAVKIRMADSDVGRLIGKSGRNIEALRTLVRVASLREHRKVFVDLATPRADGRDGRGDRGQQHSES